MNWRNLRPRFSQKWRDRGIRLWSIFSPAWNAAERLVLHDGIEIAGSMAFSTLLALFPFLIFLIAFAAFFDVEGEAREALRIAFGALPDQISNAIARPFGEALSVRSPQLLTLGAVVALWSSSNGVESLRTGLNRAYDAEETKHIVIRRLESLLVVAAVVALAVIIGWLTIVSTVIATNFPEFAQEAAGLVANNIISRYMMAGGALFVALCMAHLWLPGGSRRLFDVIPGVLISTLLWLSLAAGFTTYLANFASYDAVYGGLGGIAAVMVFFYFTAILILFGAELNRALRQHFAAKSLTPYLGDDG
ncbi:MAG: YihY/virulence factor BrkB family protein [Alphaproteobacteria bacterium]|nr:YihY/virulence factor BrkB family protein [Alphaproteobacteria bacterium]